MNASDYQAGGAQSVKRSTSRVRDEAAAALVTKAEGTLPEPEIRGKWSGRKTLVFILVTCGLAWFAIIAGIVAIL